MVINHCAAILHLILVADWRSIRPGGIGGLDASLLRFASIDETHDVVSDGCEALRSGEVDGEDGDRRRGSVGGDDNVSLGSGIPFCRICLA